MVLAPSVPSSFRGMDASISLRSSTLQRGRLVCRALLLLPFCRPQSKHVALAVSWTSCPLDLSADTSNVLKPRILGTKML